VGSRLVDATKIPLTEIPAAVALATGSKPTLRTVRRWILLGYNGTRLHVAGFGRDKFTTQEWLDEFATACGRVDSQRSCERPVTATVQQRRRSSDQADAVLREFGIICTESE